MSDTTRIILAAIQGFCLATQIAANIADPTGWPFWIGGQSITFTIVMFSLRGTAHA